jgi:hypothetical protein
MISLVLIGVATALLIWAIRAKVVADAPQRADKSQQKAEIIKQLLALSEREGKISGTAAPVRVRPRSNQSARLVTALEAHGPALPTRFGPNK